MQHLFILLLSFSCFVVNAQSSGKVLINGNEVEQIDLDAEIYELEFSLTKESIKGAWMAKANNFQYAIQVSFLQDGECELGEIYNWQDAVNGSSLASFVGSDPFKTKAEDINRLIVNSIEDCGVLPTDLQVAFDMMVLNKSGKLMTISRAILTMPSDAKAASLAKTSGEVLQMFRTGMASDLYNNDKLKKAVELYMERKWPTEDITTVHLTDQKFNNLEKTTFDVSGYYITKTANGVCKYNSFYSDVTQLSGGNYSFGFFNSVDDETTIDCSVSESLKNL